MMVGGVTTRYVYDAAGQVLLEEVGNSVSSVYTWGVDGLVRKDGEYPLVDGLGSERVVTNGSQGVTASVTYDAFGNVVARSGSSSDPYQFAGSSGYRNDGDAGLTYVGARYYDAQGGRFITRDTYLDQKPYLYCEHDPVNALDPSGHKKDPKEIAPTMWDALFGGIGAITPLGPVIGGVIGAGVGEFLWQDITEPAPVAKPRNPHHHCGRGSCG